MAQYRLHCFAQSGNAYRAALMLNLIGADWEPVFVDFFAGGETRKPEWRAAVNEMGEVPVLEFGGRRISQSGVMLTLLSRRTGKFKPQGEEQELEVLRWLLWDNQKLNGFLGPYRFLLNFAPAKPDPAVLAFLKGRLDNNMGILEGHLARTPFIVGEAPTIADISMVGYLYYPTEEHGYDFAANYPAIHAWLGRIKALPGWKHPYDLMPGQQFYGSGP